MKRAGTVAVAILLAAAPSASALLPTGFPPRHLAATPRVGGRSAEFRVRFRAPAATGATGLVGVSYQATASLIRVAAPPGAAPPRGCASVVTVAVTARRAGQRVTAGLKPGPYGPGWCVGRYSGSIEESAGPVCGPIRGPVEARREMLVCPLFATRLTELGTFSFRVR